MKIEIVWDIAVPVLGLIGFLYGFTKDRKLRQIKKRADAPFFAVSTMLLSARGETRPDEGKLYYIYHREPQSLSGGSFVGRDIDGLPEDYPDGHPFAVSPLTPPNIVSMALEPPHFVVKLTPPQVGAKNPPRIVACAALCLIVWVVQDFMGASSSGFASFLHR